MTDTPSNPKDEQLTIRLPGDLAAAIEQFAYERSIPKSMVVREALAAYVAGATAAAPANPWGKVSHMVGSLRLNARASERDDLSRRMRAHNWRT